MYVNIHSLPPNQAYFTLYIAPADAPPELTEEYDLVGPASAPANSYLTSVVVDLARATLVDMYGPTVEVRGVVNQSAGYIMFDSREPHMRPLPCVLTPRILETFDRPYDAIIDLLKDDRDMGAGTDFLDHLLNPEN